VFHGQLHSGFGEGAVCGNCQAATQKWFALTQLVTRWQKMAENVSNLKNTWNGLDEITAAFLMGCLGEPGSE